MVELHRLRDGVWWFDLRPNGVPEFISTYILVDEKIAIVEPGPACGVARLLEALAALDIAPGAVDWLLPSHIHLDHFGGGGQLLAACPNAVALVHPRGLRHVREPARLWEGARHVLGTVAEAYGAPAPLPPERSRAVEDGEAVELVHTAKEREQDKQATVEIGGKGKIETQKSLVTEVPIRGFYSYYCELMGFPVGAEAAAE